MEGVIIQMHPDKFFKKMRSELQGVNMDNIINYLGFRYVDSKSAAAFLGYKTTSSIRNLVKSGYVDEVGNRQHLTDHDGRYDLKELLAVRAAKNRL